MKFSTPSPGQYFGSLIIAAVLGLLAYFLFNSRGITDLGYILATGLILGHLSCSFFSRKTVSLSTMENHPQAATEGQATSLYVGNLAYRVQSNKLQQLFSRYGKVYSVRIMTDRETRKPRGYAFVEMDNQGAQRAMRELNEHEFYGRSLRVSEARQRPEA
jgi:hypothetical protein